MALKRLNTRIQNRFDSLTAWKADGVELLNGEIALVSVTTQQIDAATGNVVNVPAVLMKVGELDNDGNPKAFKDLPWLSAKAADVYDWAKNQYAKDIRVSVITGKDNQDNDVVETTTLGSWLANINNAANGAVERIAAVEGAIEGINGSIAGAIVAALSTLDSSDNLSDVSETDGRFVRTVTQEDGKVTVTYATITEEDIPKISANKVIVTPESGTPGEDDYVAEKTVAGRLAEISEEVSSLRTSVTGGVHFIGTVTDIPSGSTVIVNGKTHTASAGDVVIFTHNSGDGDVDDREFIYNGETWEELGDVTRIGDIETAIRNMDVTDLNDVTSTHKFVSQVTQEDGKVSVTYTQPTASDVLYTTDSTDTVYSKIDALTQVVSGKAEADHYHGEYENQNAFSNIKVIRDDGDDTISADNTTDTVEFAGNNITITADLDNDKITFAVADATDTIAGITTLGAEGGAATFETVSGIEERTSAIESDYMRIGEDDNIYAGTNGRDVIVFNCGNASSWIS